MYKYSRFRLMRQLPQIVQMELRIRSSNPMVNSKTVLSMVINQTFMHCCDKREMSACADLERVLFSFITPIFCFLTANDDLVFEFPADTLIEEIKTKSKKKRQHCLLTSSIMTTSGLSVKENSLTVSGGFLPFLFYIYSMSQNFCTFSQIPVSSKSATAFFASSDRFSGYPVISKRRMAFLVVTLPFFSR